VRNFMNNIKQAGVNGIFSYMVVNNTNLQCFVLICVWYFLILWFLFVLNMMWA
jgi:hypothetical protein